MSEVLTQYPFDPTGQNPSNRIVGEQHAISPPPWRDYHFIVPRLTPFFQQSFVLKDQTNNRTLTEGIDWIATHRFVQASRHTARPIYGSITILDKTFIGVVTLDYQTLGGDWVLDELKLYEILLNKTINPRITTWEQVANPPCQFPVIDHQWHIEDMVGMREVRDAIDRIHASMGGGDGGLSTSHLTDKNNPHEVSKAHVGLNDVENYPPSTLDQAKGGVDHASYMTPRRTRQAIEHYAYQYTDDAIIALQNWVKNYAINADQLQEALNDLHSLNVGHVQKTNPHLVTPTQIDLDAVANTPLFSTQSAISALSGDLDSLIQTAISSTT